MVKNKVTQNKRRLGILIIASFFLALSGLYGSADYPFYLRWLYWLTLVGLGIWLSDALSRQLTPLMAAWPWALKWLVFASILTLPLFGFVTAIEGLGGNPVPPDYYLDAGIKVWLVTAVLTAFGMRDDANASPETGEAPTEVDPRDAVSEPSADLKDSQKTLAAESAAPALLQRAKPSLRQANLLAITAEDHYVRLITDAGEDMILMRLADAIQETDPLVGLQVHRSWWVAKTAVTKVNRQGTRAAVTLSNGTKVPISRRRLNDAEKAGFLFP